MAAVGPKATRADATKPRSENNALTPKGRHGGCSARISGCRERTGRRWAVVGLGFHCTAFVAREGLVGMSEEVGTTDHLKGCLKL